MADLAALPALRWRAAALPTAAAVIAFGAILFGGGGAEAPLSNAVIAAFGALLLCACAASHFGARPLPREAVVPLWLGAAAVLIAALQLIPLPASIWATLPGREIAVAVSALTATSGMARPLSLDPEATRLAATALLLPIALLCATLQSDARGQILIVRAVVFAALVSALLGAFQVSLGTPAWLAPYGRPEPGVAIGTFVNANHQAQLMIAGLLATALLIRLTRPQIRVRGARKTWLVNIEWALFPLFVLLGIAAYSRAGILLLVPATAAAALIATGYRGTTRLVAIAIGLLAALGASAAVLPLFVTNALRLDTLLSDRRLGGFNDLVFTLSQYWPWGSGLGTFVPVYKANEDLHLLQPAFVNHAHNDVIEWAIETGLPGTALLIVAAVLVTLRLWRVLRRRRTMNAAPALTGFVMLALLLLHSLVDYPLRMSALGAVAAIALALLFAPLRHDWAAELDDPPERPRRSGFAPRSAGR